MAYQLTPHFKLEEFDQPARHGFDHVPYPFEWRDVAKLLAEELEVIRAFFNAPITIISGYRSPAYNKKIGGAPKSQHKLGRAADFKVRWYSPEDVQEAIVQMYGMKRLLVHGMGRYPGFTHIDIRELDKPRLVTWSGSRSES